MGLPVPWILTQTVPIENNDPYLSFVGDNKRAENKFTIKALYKTELTEWDRTKYGMNKQITGALYIPPAILEQVFGTYKIDWNKIKVQQQGQYENEVPIVINKVSYQEPLYGTCIAVILHLLDPTLA